MKMFQKKAYRISFLLCVLTTLCVACEDVDNNADKGDGAGSDVPENAFFSTDVDTLWFSRKGIEKCLEFEGAKIRTCSVVEVPDGWSGRFEGSNLYLTCPEDFELSAREGEVTVKAEFITDDEPVTMTVVVSYEQPLSLSSDYANNVAVTLSAHALADTDGYIIGSVRKRDFSAAAVVESLNAGEGFTVRTQTATYAISTLVDNYEQGAAYIVYVVSAYSAEQISSGTVSYKEDDLILVSLGSDNVRWHVSDVTFDAADLTVEVTGLSLGYHAGFMEYEDWNNYGRDNILESAGFPGQLVTYMASSFTGSVCDFPVASDISGLLPETEYIVWILPVSGTGKYSESDLVQLKFVTAGMVKDETLAPPTYSVRDITFGGFSADITPAEMAYKTYAAIRSAAVIPSDEHESLLELIKIDSCSVGQSTLVVSANSFQPDSEVYLLAVTVAADGRYSTMLKEKVTLRKLEYSDAMSVSVKELKQGEGSAEFTVEFTGSPDEIIYMVADNVFFTDAMLQEKLAMEQIGGAVVKKISKLNGLISVSGLSSGGEYVLYVVLKDAAGTPSFLYKYEFTHRMDLEYVMEVMKLMNMQGRL